MNAPRLLLADEPSGNLDRDSAHELHRLLDELRHRQGVSLVIVTHDLELARQADRVLRLADGRAQPVAL
jgi:ABC-type lipoprotein export system ATPase subunit